MPSSTLAPDASLISPFRPAWGLAQPDLQTILPEVLPRPDRRRSPWWRAQQRLTLPLSDGDHLLGWLHPLAPHAPGEAPLVIHFHGLGSSADSGTMRSLSHKAHLAGFHSLRVNWRGAGGSEDLGTGVTSGVGYADVADVVRHMHEQGHGPIYLTGFSLGGAIVLNALARLTPTPDVAGAVCISAPLDFAAAAAALREPRNRFYDARFVWLLKETLRRFVAQGRGGLRHREALKHFPAIRHVSDFDHLITAPAVGLPDAAAYYAAASPGPHLARLTVPTWLITADDDPFVPLAAQRHALNALPEHPTLHVTITDGGGHVGLVGQRPQPALPWEDHFWLENATVRRLMAWEQARRSASGA
ncbi:MAG: alpha/beta fold hydrolase [Candidatus Sericytochromatia bacterium]|nr:alpha/beta fold hydrolase [Candidatus Sericytochromatia bacterium]